jgi:hypothetical protein
MKILLILLGYFICFAAICQPTVKIKDKKTNEEYYVLKSDPAVKHGSYKILNFKQLAEEGFYNLNKKDSSLVEYINGEKIGEGKYSNDEKVGIWQYYKKKEIVSNL